jgi:RNA polymerase sigma-70 factor (ECF subfamily)
VLVAQRNPETEMGGGPNAFQSTLWSVVLRAKDPASPERREALEKLIETYWKPLYFFVRRRGKNPEESKDLTQGFFAELLAKDYLKTFDPERGKFRAFLLSAFKHYMADRYDHDRAQKRGGDCKVLSLDFAGAETEGIQADSEPDQAYRRDWAVQVMSQAMEALKASYHASGRGAEFEQFKAHLTSLHPQGADYKSLAGSLGISIDDVRNRVRAARTRYRKAILDVIRSYTDSSDEAREELQDLLAAFS